MSEENFKKEVRNCNKYEGSCKRDLGRLKESWKKITQMLKKGYKDSEYYKKLYAL